MKTQLRLLSLCLYLISFARASEEIKFLKEIEGNFAKFELIYMELGGKITVFKESKKMPADNERVFGVDGIHFKKKPTQLGFIQIFTNEVYLIVDSQKVLHNTKNEKNEIIEVSSDKIVNLLKKKSEEQQGNVPQK